MSINVTRSKQSVTEEQLRAVEQKLDVKLPEAYRSFLKMHNGGTIEPETYWMTKVGSGEREKGCVNWLYGIGEGVNLELAREYELMRGRLPPNFLAIADDPGGNLICLSLYGPDQNAVYFWDHELELDKKDRSGYSNVYFIADSFQQFLDGLFSYLDDTNT